MNDIEVFRRKQPWRDALIATTGFAVFMFLASLLWKSGHAEWAFVLAFVALWLLLSISWSNIDFTEQSGSILASIMDHNFLRMSERIDQLEHSLDRIQSLSGNGIQDAPSSGEDRQERLPEQTG